jgi:hypothetical protein
MREKGALVAVLIIERPLCLNCIAQKSAIAADEVEPLLARIATKVAITKGRRSLPRVWRD